MDYCTHVPKTFPFSKGGEVFARFSSSSNFSCCWPGKSVDSRSPNREEEGRYRVIKLHKSCFDRPIESASATRNRDKLRFQRSVSRSGWGMKRERERKRGCRARRRGNKMDGLGRFLYKPAWHRLLKKFISIILNIYELKI